MALTEEQLKSDLEGYLRKLAGVMPVGHYWFGIDPKSKPAGVQLYSGQLLFRSAYQKHWEFVSGGHRTVLSEEEWQAMVDEQGFCPYFSYGNGSTTYRMPLVKGVHPKFVSALSEAGQYVQAGLPNITGGVNSDTVQPPALTTLIGEYVVGSVTILGEADAESLLASVTMLESNIGALESGSGYNAAGKAEIVGWGMPDYSAGVTFTVGVSSTFTAPQKGVAMIYVNSSASNGWVDLNGVHLTKWGGSNVQHCFFAIPVYTDDILSFSAVSGSILTASFATFFPYKGA